MHGDGGILEIAKAEIRTREKDHEAIRHRAYPYALLSISYVAFTAMILMANLMLRLKGDVLAGEEAGRR